MRMRISCSIQPNGQKLNVLGAFGFVLPERTVQGEFDQKKFRLWLAGNGPQLALRELKLVLFDSKWANLAWFERAPLIWLASKK